jgi:hypothetical protein
MTHGIAILIVCCVWLVALAALWQVSPWLGVAGFFLSYMLPSTKD